MFTSDTFKRPLIVLFLFLFVAINFADKLVVGIVAVPMRQELGISSSEFGLVGSSFYLLFSVSAVLVGIYSDRIRTKTLLALMVAAWSLFQLPIAFAPSLATLFIFRLLLGAAEGPATPMCLLLLYKWFSDRNRVLPTTLIITFGSAAGVGIGSHILTNVNADFGWRAPFMLLAVVGGVWLLAWLLLGQEEPKRRVDDSLPSDGALDYTRISYAALLLTPTYLSVAACAFTAYWITTLLVVWFPSFLAEVHQLGAGEIAWLISGVATAKALIAIGGTTISHLMSARGMPSRQARVLPLVLFIGLGGVAALCIGLGATGMVLIVSAIAMFGAVAVVFPLAFAMSAELAPPTMRGSALSIMSAVATTGGFFAPVTMGLLIDWAGSPENGYAWGFLITAILTLLTALAGLLLARPQRDAWRVSPDDAAQRVAAP